MLPDVHELNLIQSIGLKSQCTYRCVVLPDYTENIGLASLYHVSMHLQVRGAP